LIKLCYWSFEEDTRASGGRLNFRKFPTDRIDACIEFMRRLAVKHKLQNGNHSGQDHDSAVQDEEDQDDGSLYVVATGGGAYKFYDLVKEALGVKVMREDEMECLIIGTHIPFSLSRLTM
jgi:type II pantothenate kinase